MRLILIPRYGDRPVRLTQEVISALQYDPGGPSQQIHWCKTLPGFGVRVYPSGKKSFVLRYHSTTHGGILKVIGQTNRISLSDAKKEAARIRNSFVTGKDPFEEPSTMTISQFAAIYMQRHARPKKRSWREDQRRLDQYIIPALGKFYLHEVTRKTLVRLHAEIGEEKPYAANRIIEQLSKMFALAVDWEYLPEGSRNPASGIKAFAEKDRERFLLAREVPEFMRCLNEYPNVYVRHAILFLLFTGLRKSEVLQLEWEDVDLDFSQVRVRQSKAQGAFYQPINRLAVELLEKTPKKPGNPFIFCGQRRGKALYTIQKPWEEIRKNAGLEDLQLHDLRRTVGSWLAQDGTTLHSIGRLLRQSTQRTTEVYSRLTDEQSRAAADQLADLIGGYLEDEDQEEAANGKT